MRPLDYFSESLDSLRKHKMRALLTMLGIIVGVFTVIITLGVGAGARMAIESQISALGSNLVAVNSGPPPSVGRQPIALYLTDARAILEHCPSVVEVSPQQETRLAVSFASNQLADNFVMGVTASYARVRLAQMQQGRFVSDHDDVTAAKVAVLGTTVAQYLFHDQEPLGKRMLISGVDFEVIGVLDSKGDSPGLGPGMSTDDRIFIPLSALQKRLLGSTDLRVIAITARDANQIPVVVSEVKTLLDRRHPGNGFEIKTQLELMQTSESVSSIVTLLLTALAAVSLFVGGIGIMNIMLVAVTERTREIGIRRAIGARRKSVVIQFLMESSILSSAGGCIGIVTGIGISSLAGKVFGWTIPVLPTGIVLALTSSLVVGITSGIYPARRAARLNLVDALRFE
jgi:ABC-type antimicrobial peptide transport system permease subunit